jgi:hypothetical protein
VMLQCDTGSCWPGGVRPCQFYPGLAKNFAHITNHDQKTDPICCHETISVASRPLDVLHIDPMNDATV